MESGMLFVLFKLLLIQNKSQHYKKDRECKDCIWMLTIFSVQLYYSLEISLEMFSWWSGLQTANADLKLLKAEQWEMLWLAKMQVRKFSGEVDVSALHIIFEATSKHVPQTKTVSILKNKTSHSPLILQILLHTFFYFQVSLYKKSSLLHTKDTHEDSYRLRQ